MPQPFPAHKLQPYLEQIRQANPSQQAIAFYPNNWNIPILDTHFQTLLRTIPQLTSGCITRQWVEQIGNFASQNLIPWDGFFLAVMIWGYGTVGYGPWRTQQMFQTANFANIFASIRNQIQNNNVKEAYNLALIDRCGPPFFTKLFYFLGRVFNSQPLPVILDSRVAASLLKCNGNDFNGVAYFKQKAATRFSLGYMEYVSDVNLWGQANNFSPDQLEIFLFSPPVDF